MDRTEHVAGELTADKTFEQLHRLIKKGDLIAVRDLLASGVDANLRTRSGWTPLMLAANHGQTAIVSFLLSAGADVQATDECGASALAYAALRGECRTIQVLLDAGASLDVRPYGVSLLAFARSGDGSLKTQRHFELLRSAGAT